MSNPLVKLILILCFWLILTLIIFIFTSRRSTKHSFLKINIQENKISNCFWYNSEWWLLSWFGNSEQVLWSIGPFKVYNLHIYYILMIFMNSLWWKTFVIKKNLTYEFDYHLHFILNFQAIFCVNTYLLRIPSCFS